MTTAVADLLHAVKGSHSAAHSTAVTAAASDLLHAAKGSHSTPHSTVVTTAAADLLHAWRHPSIAEAAGRCLGRTDLPADPRRARRLAHRIRTFARRHDLPRVVVTSPLRRSHAVGRWLARWGWRHQVDAALTELDFGRWDGRPWPAVPLQEIDAWCADFERHAPGGGEPVSALLRRVRDFDPGPARIVVTHGGWLSAATWLARGASAPPCSERWPAPPKHGERVAFGLCSGGAGSTIVGVASDAGAFTPRSDLLRLERS